MEAAQNPYRFITRLLPGMQKPGWNGRRPLHPGFWQIPYVVASWVMDLT